MKKQNRLHIKKVCAIISLVAMLSATAAQSAVVIYEPFAQTAGSISGKAGGAGLNNWAVVAGPPTVATTPTLASAQLPIGGGELSVPSGAGVTAYVATTAALSGAGLLADGATLWFGFLYSKASGGGSNERSGFAFGTDHLITSGTAGASMSNLGNGLGIYSRDKSIQPSTWVGGGGGVQAAGTSFANYGDTVMIVGKIVWGATSGDVETLTIWTPDETSLPLNEAGLGSGWSTTMTGVDQTLFDTISMQQRNSGGSQIYDEVRFGATYADVIGGVRACWDIDGAIAGAGGATPSGTWDATTPNWNDAGDGTSAASVWSAGNAAVFAAGTDANGTYTVTVDSIQEFGGLAFEEGSVTLTGGTALKMTSDSTLYVASGAAATIATPLSEDAPRVLSKTGSGSLILSADNSAATGGMSLNEGVTQFDSPASINGTTRNITVNLGAAAVFGPSFDTGSGEIASALLNRIVATSTGAIVADNYAATDFDFDTAGLTAASLGAVGTVNYTGAYTPNGSTTVRLGGGGGTLILNSTLPSTKTLNVSGPGTLRLNGYDTTVAGLSSTGSGQTLENGAAGNITLTVNNSAANTYAGVLGDGTGGGTLSLVKTNSGTLTLSGDNAFTGDITIDGGTLTFSSLNAWGGSGKNVTFSGDALLNSTVDGYTTGQVTVNSGVTASFACALTMASATGPGTLLGRGRAKTLTIADGSAFTGAVFNCLEYQYTTIQFASLDDSPGAGNIQFGGGSSDGGQDGVIRLYGDVGPLTLNNRQIEVLVKTANHGYETIKLENNNATPANKWVINTDLINNETYRQKILILGGSNLGDNEFAGVIPDGGNMVALQKQDAGKWILSGENTFSGTTTVGGGTLVLAAGTCLSDTNLLSIASGKVVQLEANVKELVGLLTLGGVPQADGVYGSTSSRAPLANQSAYFDGTGLLYVNTPLPPSGTVIMFR